MYKSLYIILFLFTASGAQAQQLPERSLVRKGNRQYNKGNYEQSAGRYEQALQAAPGQFEAIYNLGNALYKAERFDRAEQTMQQAAADALRAVFGVKGMAYRSMTDGLVHLLRREAMSKGVKVTYNEDGTVSIELHIIVENGVNIATVCRSIMGEVKYVVTKNTGVEVREVNVFVDSITV